MGKEESSSSRARGPSAMGKEDEQKKAAARSAKNAGDKAYGIEDYKAAEEYYRYGASLDPSDMSFLMKRANAMFGMKKEEECLQYCDMLIKGGTDKEELIKEAELLKKIMRANQATCATDCDAVIAALNLCSGEKAKAKLAEAKSMRKMFVNQERRNQKANELGQEARDLLEEGRDEEAENAFTKAISNNPWDHSNFRGRAQCLINQDKFTEAVEDADRCIRLDPNSGEGYIWKACSQYKMGDLDDALSTIADCLDHDPGNPNIPGLLRCFAGLSQIAESNSDASSDSSSQTEYESKLEQLRSQYHQLNKKLHSAKEHANLKPLLEEYKKRSAELRQYFICPLTQGVMTYPVTAADGQTYEAEEIMILFEFDTKSPITREEFKHTELIPDDRMRSAIEKWQQLEINLWNKCRTMLDSL